MRIALAKSSVAVQLIIGISELYSAQSGRLTWIRELRTTLDTDKEDLNLPCLTWVRVNFERLEPWWQIILSLTNHRTCKDAYSAMKYFYGCLYHKERSVTTQKHKVPRLVCRDTDMLYSVKSVPTCRETPRAETNPLFRHLKSYLVNVYNYA